MGRSVLGRIWPASLFGKVIADHPQAWATYSSSKAPVRAEVVIAQSK